MADRERTEPRLLFDVRTPMRDGVELSCDVHLPPIKRGVWPDARAHRHTIGSSDIVTTAQPAAQYASRRERLAGRPCKLDARALSAWLKEGN